MRGVAAERIRATLSHPTRLGRPKRSSPLLAIVAIVMTLLIGLPILAIIVNSFNTAPLGEPASYGLENYRSALETPRVWSALRNSVLLVLTRNFIALPIAFSLAWLIARTDMPGRRLLEVLMWLSIFLPSLPLTFGWILLLEPRVGLVNNVLEGLFGVRPFTIYGFWGITWVNLVTSTIGYMVILLLPFLRRLAPALEEAAHTSGARPITTMRRITLPLLMPAMLGIFFLSIVIGLAGFEVELLLGLPERFYVFSTLIYDFIRDPQPHYGMATVLGFALLVLMLVLAIFHRFYSSRREVATVTGRGFRPSRISLGRWRYVASGVSFGWVAITVAVPMIFLILGSFMRRYGFFQIEDPFTLINWQQMFADPAFLRSTKNTLIIASSVALASILLYSIVAYVIVRNRGKVSDFIDVVSWLPWAIPGILMGLAMLWLLLSTPLRGIVQGSLIAVIVAIIIQDSPRSTLMFKTGTSQIAKELEESAALSGAKWFKMYRRVLLPLLAPTAATVGLLSFLSAVREISVPILMSSSATRPLSILMLEYATSDLFERAVAIGVFMAGGVLVLTLIALRLGFNLEDS